MHSQVDGWCLKSGLAGTRRDERPGHSVPSPQVTLLEALNGPVTGVTLWALLTLSYQFESPLYHTFST